MITHFNRTGAGAFRLTKYFSSCSSIFVSIFQILFYCKSVKEHGIIMFGILKHVVVISLTCRFCNGENIEKCFTLDKITPTQGDIYFDWQKTTRVSVNLYCTNGLIRFHQMTYYIPKYKMHKCLADKCSYNVGYQSCDCCKKPPYSSQLCYHYSQVDAQSKDDCESRKECSLPIDIMDLSGYCANETKYSCDQGWCYSRWVEVYYTCEPGMDMKLVSTFCP